MRRKVLSKRKPNNDSFFFGLHFYAHATIEATLKYFCVGINAYFRLVRAIVFVPLLEKIWWCDKYTFIIPPCSELTGNEGRRTLSLCVRRKELFFDDNPEENKKITFATHGLSSHAEDWKHETISRALFKCYCEFYFFIRSIWWCSAHALCFRRECCFCHRHSSLRRHSSVFRVRNRVRRVRVSTMLTNTLRIGYIWVLLLLLLLVQVQSHYGLGSISWIYWRGPYIRYGKICCWLIFMVNYAPLASSFDVCLQSPHRSHFPYEFSTEWSKQAKSIKGLSASLILSTINFGRAACRACEQNEFTFHYYFAIMRFDKATRVGWRDASHSSQKSLWWWRAVYRHKVCLVFEFHFITLLFVNRCDGNKANRCSATIFILSPNKKIEFILLPLARWTLNYLWILLARAMIDQTPTNDLAFAMLYFCHLFALCHRRTWKTTKETNGSHLIRAICWGWKHRFGRSAISSNITALAGIAIAAYLQPFTGSNYILIFLVGCVRIT